MLTLFGVAALSFMMLMYAVERRHRGFIVAFACGCALSSLYGFLSGAWPFGVVEAIWTAVAIHRYRHVSRREPGRAAAG
jgi:predicted membrane-bound mannosyltransferase